MATIVANYTPAAHPDRQVEVSYDEKTGMYLVAIVKYRGASLNPFEPCSIISADDLSLRGTRDGCRGWVETRSIQNLEEITNNLIELLELEEDPLGSLFK